MASSWVSGPLGHVGDGVRHRRFPFLSVEEMRGGLVQEHVDRTVDEAVPAVAAGVVGDLLVGEAGEHRGPQVDGLAGR